MSIRNRKVELGAATRMALIKGARGLFRAGYEAVGTPEIAAAAGVTRGALYHHFKNKRDLFAAVVEDVALDVLRQINDAAAREQEAPVDAIVSGSMMFLEACLNDETRQIFLVDAPSVLGWQEWRSIDARHGLGSLKEGLVACAEAGYLAREDIDPVAHLLSGALNEAVFLLAERADAALSRRVGFQIERMIRAQLAP